jgi:hypothetical protein
MNKKDISSIVLAKDIKIISCETEKEFPNYTEYKLHSEWKGRKFYTQLLIPKKLEKDILFDLEDYKKMMVRESLISLLVEENAPIS